MFERISLKLGELLLALKREDGQGATEYAMVIGFLVVGLAIGLGVLGVAIETSSTRRRQDRRPDSVGIRCLDGSESSAWIGLRAQRRRVCGARSRPSTPPRRGSSGSLRSKALRAPAGGGGFAARAARRRSSSRMVVPLLCLIIVAILHFGKVMNYWLDLNHVASEGARKAAVNTYGSTANTTLRPRAGWRPASCAPAARPRSRTRPRSRSACRKAGTSATR